MQLQSSDFLHWGNFLALCGCKVVMFQHRRSLPQAATADDKGPVGQRNFNAT